MSPRGLRCLAELRGSTAEEWVSERSTARNRPILPSEITSEIGR
jgi:hypothetical protein